MEIEYPHGTGTLPPPGTLLPPSDTLHADTAKPTLNASSRCVPPLRIYTHCYSHRSPQQRRPDHVLVRIELVRYLQQMMSSEQQAASSKQ